MNQISEFYFSSDAEILACQKC